MLTCMVVSELVIEFDMALTLEQQHAGRGGRNSTDREELFLDQSRGICRPCGCGDGEVSQRWRTMAGRGGAPPPVATTNRRLVVSLSADGGSSGRRPRLVGGGTVEWSRDGP